MPCLLTLWAILSHGPSEGQGPMESHRAWAEESIASTLMLCDHCLEILNNFTITFVSLEFNGTVKPLGAWLISDPTSSRPSHILRAGSGSLTPLAPACPSLHASYHCLQWEPGRGHVHLPFQSQTLNTGDLMGLS